MTSEEIIEELIILADYPAVIELAAQSLDRDPERKKDLELWLKNNEDK